jgi:hypothetical protein
MTLIEDSVADIVRQFLIDGGLGQSNLASDWAVFVGQMPDQPDKAICVYSGLGRIDGRIMRTGEQVEHPGVQVIVRGTDYPSAEHKSREVALGFDGQRGSVVQMASDRFYTLLNISREGAVHPLGIMEDDRRRYHFSINAVLTLKEES